MRMNQDAVPGVMHPRTIATLEKLEKAHWFSRLGIQDAEGYAIVVSSWDEAMAYCTSAESRNLWLEAANQFRERLKQVSNERFMRWNDIVAEVRPVVRSLVARKTASVTRENNLPPAFENRVRWEIIHLCMEGEYADVYPPGFFASHAYWYVAGHFPCGWEGQFSNYGKLVIY